MGDVFRYTRMCLPFPARVCDLPSSVPEINLHVT